MNQPPNGKGPGGIGAQLQHVVGRGPGGSRVRPDHETIAISNVMFKKILGSVNQQPLDCALNAINNALCMLAVQGRIPVDFIHAQIDAAYKVYLEQAMAAAKQQQGPKIILPGKE